MTTTERRRILKACERLDWELRTRKYPSVIEADEPREEEPAHCDPRSDEQWALDEQYPSQRNF